MKLKTTPLSKQTERQLTDSLKKIINEFSFNPSYEVLKPALDIVSHILNTTLSKLDDDIKETCVKYSKSDRRSKDISERQLLGDIKRKEEVMDCRLFVKALDIMLKKNDADSALDKKVIKGDKDKMTSKKAKKMLKSCIASDKAAGKFKLEDYAENADKGRKKPRKPKYVKKSSPKKIIDHTGSVKSGKVLTGLKQNQLVIYKNRTYIFVEYKDEGFTAMIKRTKNSKPFLVFGSELSLPTL